MKTEVVQTYRCCHRPSHAKLSCICPIVTFLCIQFIRIINARCQLKEGSNVCDPFGLAYLGFQCLDHPPYSPDLTPSDYHLFFELKKKTIERSPFFVRRGSHCCHEDLVGRTTFWFFFFLSGLQKLEQRANKCIELRGEHVE